MSNQTEIQKIIHELFIKLDNAGLVNASQTLPLNFKKIIA